MPDKDIVRLIDVATGREHADFVIKNAKIFNVFTGLFTEGDLAVDHGWIAGIGSYKGRKTHDAKGAWLTPGLFDGHVHIESGMVSPQEFARCLVAKGTTTIIADPHEIANVAGTDGLQYILDVTADLPLNVFIMLPSCVPASPLEWGGARLTANDLAIFMNHPRVLGLGEMMNFPGVIYKDPEVMAKLRLMQGRQIDGHSPRLAGPELNAYAAAGIRNDHECLTVKEARDRLELGLAVLMRQGSAARNLLNLLPAVDAHTAPFCLMATDDRHPEDLMTQGHINYLLRLAVNEGKLDTALALKMATINGPIHFGLRHLGAIAPGFRADMALFPDLKNFEPSHVWKDGQLAAENGHCLLPAAKYDDSRIKTPIRLNDVTAADFRVPATGSKIRVIGLIPGEIVTEHLTISPEPVNGCFVADPDNDLVKIAVLERHRGSGGLALGFLKGLGLKHGAVASTVAHDSHNLIIAGTNDEDMAVAASEIKRLGGGLAVADQGRVIGSLPLPLAGLMADQSMEKTAAALAKLQDIVRGLGLVEGHDPFMTLAFMSLPVIPKLKLTEAGLVDVEKFEHVSLVFN